MEFINKPHAKKLIGTNHPPSRIVSQPPRLIIDSETRRFREIQMGNVHLNMTKMNVDGMLIYENSFLHFSRAQRECLRRHWR